MPTLSEQQFKKLLIALAVYLTALIASNTLGLKLMPFFFGLHLSVGIFMFPIVFLATDVIGEVYGRKMARLFVLAGFVSTAIFILFSYISLAMPWAEAGEWVRESYGDVFGLSARIAIASLVAFIVAEYQDVLTFFLLRDKWGEGNFWLRSNLSNLWSQFLDTAIFMSIAFLGVYPLATLINLSISWWLFKVAMGFFYTPLSYVGLWFLREPEQKS